MIIRWLESSISVATSLIVGTIWSGWKNISEFTENISQKSKHLMKYVHYLSLCYVIENYYSICYSDI